MHLQRRELKVHETAVDPGSLSGGFSSGLIDSWASTRCGWAPTSSSILAHEVGEAVERDRADEQYGRRRGRDPRQRPEHRI